MIDFRDAGDRLICIAYLLTLILIGASLNALLRGSLQ